MKKYFWLLLLLPGIFYLIGSKKKESTASQPPKQNNRLHSKYETSRKIFLGKKSAAMANVSSVDCPGSAKILDVDFNIPLREWVNDLRAQDFSNCKDPDLIEGAAFIRQHCFNGKIDVENCYANLLKFRSLIRIRGIKDPSSREELADLILAEFSKKSPDFNKLRKFSKELLRQDPNDRPVQKVWAMSAVIAGDPKNLSPDLVNEIYQTLDPDEIRNDPELRGLDVIMKTGLKAGSVEEYSREILKNNPADFGTREMLGWSLWQQGRREEAIAEVNSILARKNDPYLSKIRDRLTSADATLESFPGRLSLGVKLEDLWN